MCITYKLYIRKRTYSVFCSSGYFQIVVILVSLSILETFVLNKKIELHELENKERKEFENNSRTKVEYKWCVKEQRTWTSTNTLRRSWTRCWSDRHLKWINENLQYIKVKGNHQWKDEIIRDAKEFGITVETIYNRGELKRRIDNCKKFKEKFLKYSTRMTMSKEQRQKWKNEHVLIREETII